MIFEKILNELTDVRFENEFKLPLISEIERIDNIDLPVYKSEALVIGTGAAGLRTAVELKRKGIDVIIATDGLYRGTSACSGSDKQTLFTAATSAKGDDYFKLAEALSAGGGMDGDIAYVESVGSIHTLAGLQYLGLDLPEDKLGGILRYQTDHDEAGRATSCGPRTSRLMVKVLLSEVKTLNIPILPNSTAIKLIKNDKSQCCGAVFYTNEREHNEYGFAAVRTNNVILATGGPGELYRDSAYPKSCFGSLGLALEEGLVLSNIIESQFGIGTPSTGFPWNLSGSYVQVIPYIYSIDDNGQEYNFLANYYRTTQELASNIFRKGYQWPFHATRTLEYGSSLVDMAIAKEKSIGRKVYMDFNRNPLPVPRDKPFSLERLDSDVYEYLSNNQILDSLPIDRLKRMNPLSISLYAMHGYDITQSPLEFSVNNQHMNGGIEIDIWGKTSLENCFALGEVAGSHGVTRPGGAALNSGQVFAVRIAKYISKRKLLSCNDSNINARLDKYILECRDIANSALGNNSGLDLKTIKADIQNRMSDKAGFICSIQDVKSAVDESRRLREKIYSNGIKIHQTFDIRQLFMWRHQSLASEAIIRSLHYYIEQGGGSRGARIILDEYGKCIPHGANGEITEWQFRPENEQHKTLKYQVKFKGGEINCFTRTLRDYSCINDIFFEKNWPDFLTAKIIED